LLETQNVHKCKEYAGSYSSEVLESLPLQNSTNISAKKHKFSGIKSHFIDKVPVSKTKPVLGLDDILDV